MNDSIRIPLTAVMAAGLALPGSAVLAASRPALASQQQTHTRIPIVAAADLVGRPVVDRHGHDAGRVDSIVIDSKNGVVKFVALAGRGHFDLNGRLIAVPWPVIAHASQRGAIRLAVSAKKLERAPRVSRSKLFKMGTLGYRRRVYGYYGRPYPYYGTRTWYIAYRNGYPYSVAAPGAAIPPAPNAEKARNAARPAAATGAGNGTAPTDNTTADGNNGANGGTQRANVNAATGHVGLAISRNGIVSELHKVSSVQPGQLRSLGVYSRKGDHPVGHIDQVMIDTRAGTVAYALIKRGGFLGLDPTWSAVPVEALQWRRITPGTEGYGGGVHVRAGYRLTVSAQQLKGVPSVPVNQNRLTTYAPRRDLARLYRHFDIKPYWQTQAGRQSTTGAGAQ